MGSPTTLRLDLRPPTQEQIYSWYCKSDQQVMVGKLTSQWVRITTITLLNAGSIKLPSEFIF